MKWFKKKEDKFELEHYPLTGIHVAKFNGEYLKEDETTGFIEINSYADEDVNLSMASHFKSEKEAIKLIEKFKEQKFKKNVIVKEIK